MTGTDYPLNNLDPERVRAVIAYAWNGLDPQDQAERLAYDAEHNVSGCTMHVDDELIEFRRGGRTLAIVPLDVLAGHGEMDAVFIGDVPDDASELDNQ